MDEEEARLERRRRHEARRVSILGDGEPGPTCWDRYLEHAEPGPWRDKLFEIVAWEKANKAVWAENLDAYLLHEDTPHERRGALPEDVKAGVAAICAHQASWEAMRLAYRATHQETLRTKAAEFGAMPTIEGEPEWVRLLRDVHALRVWRQVLFDGSDRHLPSTLLGAGEMYELRAVLFPAYRAWAEARGSRLNPILYDLKKIAWAGLLPGVTASPDMPGWSGKPHDHEERFEKLVEEKGAAALRDEVLYAYRVLPEASFPVPSSQLVRLGTRVAAGEPGNRGWTVPQF